MVRLIYFSAVLPVTLWKPDAIIRLFFSVFVCWFGGSVLASLTPFTGAAKAHSAAAYATGAGALLCLGTAVFIAWRRWSLDHFMRQMTLLLVCFYAGMALGAWTQKLAGAAMQSAGQVSIGAISFQGAALVLTIPFLREHGLSWGEAFGLSNRRRDAVLAGVVVACLFLPIGLGLQHFSNHVLSELHQFGLKPQEQVAVQVLRTAASSPDRIKLALVTILLAPIAEEVLFRGILFTGVRQLGFPRLAFWGTGLVFAFVHFNAASFLPLFVFALVLAWIYGRTGNLLAPMAAHSVFNALNFTMLFLFKEGPPGK
jgi:membrane protease YdiL (CAAX protease family)